MKAEHLTNSQIREYHAGVLGEGESLEIGQHLLQCAICRNLLPMPSPERFWAAINTERDIEESYLPEERKLFIPSLVSFYSRLFKQRLVFAWSGGILVIFLTFSILMLFGGFQQSNKEGEIARSYNLKDMEIDSKQPEIEEHNITPSTLSSENEITASSSESDRVVTNKQPKKLRRNAKHENLDSSFTKKFDQNLKGKVLNNNISSTRGATSKCVDENTVEMEIGRNKEIIVLKWKKIPNAAKYHLYISDDEEILIDEYETETETEYVLKKSLDPLKTYKWNVVITLEDGQTMAGTSQKFIVNDVRQNQKKLSGKRRSGIRCSENK